MQTASCNSKIAVSHHRCANCGLDPRILLAVVTDFAVLCFVLLLIIAFIFAVADADAAAAAAGRRATRRKVRMCRKAR